jgi:hypothetical protein
VGVFVAAFLLLVATAYICLFVRVVPPIFGKIVDAATGQPVPAISVCLRVDADGLGHAEVLRTEEVNTDDSGRFAFSPSVHDLPILTEWRGYSVRLTDPRNDLAVSCGPDLGPGLNEVHPGRGILMTGYFPVTPVNAAAASKSKLPWSSTRRRMSFPLGMRIALVPVLSVPDECGRVKSPQLARDCREMMTEISALPR